MIDVRKKYVSLDFWRDLLLSRGFESPYNGRLLLSEYSSYTCHGLRLNYKNQARYYIFKKGDIKIYVNASSLEISMFPDIYFAWKDTLLRLSAMEFHKKSELSLPEEIIMVIEALENKDIDQTQLLLCLEIIWAKSLILKLVTNKKELAYVNKFPFGSASYS